MCRFLSKFILDWVLPLPFAMFRVRSDYISALVNGRKLDSFYSPRLLMQLLLKEAIFYYESMLNRVQNTTFIHRYITADSETDLKNKIKELDEETRAKMLEEFKNMQTHNAQVIKCKDETISLFKYPDICLDDI